MSRLLNYHNIYPLPSRVDKNKMDKNEDIAGKIDEDAGHRDADE